jgi:hypothetical protein
MGKLRLASEPPFHVGHGALHGPEIEHGVDLETGVVLALVRPLSVLKTRFEARGTDRNVMGRRNLTSLGAVMTHWESESL